MATKKAGKAQSEKASAVMEKKDNLAEKFGRALTGTDGTVIDGSRIARNMRTYFRMYRSNTDLRRCIAEIVQTTGKSGYETYRVNKAGDREVVIDARFERLLLSSGGFRKLKSQIIQQVAISGTVFVLKDKNPLGTEAEWSVLDSRYISIVSDTTLTIKRFMYQHPKLQSVKAYLPDEVSVFSMHSDPDNLLFGISDVETIVFDIALDEEASMSNMAYFANDATPSALYIVDESLQDEQVEDIMQNIKKSMAGGHNKYKAIGAPAIKDVKPLNGNQKDIDFVSGRKLTTERICAAMGVPKIILGYTEGVNYSNAQEQYSKFIENTIRPYEAFVTEIMQSLMMKNFSGLFFAINDEHIDDLKERSTIARDNVAKGIWTRNEAREYIGYAPVDETENSLMKEYTVEGSPILLSLLPERDPNAVEAPQSSETIDAP